MHRTLGSVGSFLLALGLLTAPLAQAAEPLRPWGGPRVAVKTRHLAAGLKKDDDYWDKYTFNADFGDRGSFYFSFALTNLGPGDDKGEAKGRLTIDDKKFAWSKELDGDEWKHTADPFSLTAGAISISGTPEKILFKNEEGQEAFELEFTPIARAWRPRDGQATYGKDQKVFDVTLFPLMKVTGRYKLAGADWQNIEGRGYGSHTWGEIQMYDQARWTLDLRLISGNYTVYMRELSTAEDYGRVRMPYLLITKGAEILIEAFDYQFEATDVMTDEKHENKYKVPQSFTLVGTDGEDPTRQFRAVVKKKALNKRKDYLADMGTLKSAVVSRYSEPVLYDYDVDVTFEVKIGDRVEQIKGVGRYEVNHLNK